MRDNTECEANPNVRFSSGVEKRGKILTILYLIFVVLFRLSVNVGDWLKKELNVNFISKG